ncbi:hypothetical protein BGX33_001121 [Mortierella sp. NVP41]|nr:hypothetical protein BGX33_001121 [Mortierella sp. NVP41]
MLSCCTSDRKYKNVAATEQEPQVKNQSQTQSQSKRDQDEIALEEYMIKRLTRPPGSNLVFSTGMRRHQFYR